MTLGLPNNVEKYFETKVFTEKSLPEKITKKHNTKTGVWGRIVVLEGELDYIVSEPPKSLQRLSPGIDGVIQPKQQHYVCVVGPVRFKIEFLKAPPN